MIEFHEKTHEDKDGVEIRTKMPTNSALNIINASLALIVSRSHKIFIERSKFLIDCVGLQAWQGTSNINPTTAIAERTMAKRKELDDNQEEEPESQESSSEEISSDDVQTQSTSPAYASELTFEGYKHARCRV